MTLRSDFICMICPRFPVWHWTNLGELVGSAS